MPAEGPLRDRNAAGFELIETMRWQPGSGIRLIDRHLARLTASARDLGFACDREAIRARLVGLDAAADQRVRLALAQDGSTTLTVQPFAPLELHAVWRIAIARARLDSNDPLLRHKTTRRGIYAAARAEQPVEVIDEMILLNERGELCEGTITSLFVDAGEGGPLLTPALTCGLLAGVLRAEMLDTGRAREAVLTASNFETARSLYVGNALRGLIPARLHSPLEPADR